MPQILDPVTVSAGVAAKIKTAMEQKTGQSLTDAEAKAEFRKMVLRLARNDVKSYLRDKAREDNMPDTGDVESDLGDDQ